MTVGGIMKNLLIKSALLVLLVPLSGFALAEEDSSVRLFEALDVFELEYASDLQVSPDGNQILYARCSNDIMRDFTRSNIWIINKDGSGHRSLLSGRESASSARWSPDGGRIAYISSSEGSPQLYVRWMDTGQTALVTNLTQSPSAISWSPDGKWIAFSMAVLAETKPMISAPPKPKDAEWAPEMNVIESVTYRFDGRGYLVPSHSHIFVVPAEGGTPWQLTSGDYNHAGSLSWTPDGSQIFFSANRSADWEYESFAESDIYSINVTDGLLTQITNRQGSERSPMVSPDGRHLAYLQADNNHLAYENTVLVVAGLGGVNPEILTGSMDRSVGNINWADNGTGLYFQYTDRANVKVGFASLFGNIDHIAENLGGTTLGRPYSSGSYDVGAGTVAFTSASATRPADVSVVTGTGEYRQLTFLNEDLFGQITLGQVHEIIYESALDGQEIQGWYITPPDFDPAKKYPLILPYFVFIYCSLGIFLLIFFINQYKFLLQFHYLYNKSRPQYNHYNNLDLGQVHLLHFFSNTLNLPALPLLFPLFLFQVNLHNFQQSYTNIVHQIQQTHLHIFYS